MDIQKVWPMLVLLAEKKELTRAMTAASTLVQIVEPLLADKTECKVIETALEGAGWLSPLLGGGSK